MQLKKGKELNSIDMKLLTITLDALSGEPRQSPLEFSQTKLNENENENYFSNKV